MAFRPLIPDNIRSMDARIFVEGKMGLKESSPMSLDERVSYDAENNVVYANFEGMNIGTEEEAESSLPTSTVTSRDSGVRCTSWSTMTTSTSAGRPRYLLCVVKYNEDNYFLSSTRYSTDAFFRHQLREDFAQADRAAHLPQLRRGTQELAGAGLIILSKNA